MTLRPVDHLAAAMRLYPGAPGMIDCFRAGRGKDLPDWPDWCFLPLAAWYAIVSADAGLDALPPHLVGDVGRLAAIGTWRYSQGVYQFHPDLRAALTDTIVAGPLPSEVLLRLPEWAVYIETPGRHWFNQPLHGFWAHLEWDANDGRRELRLLLDCQQDLLPIPLHLGAWTVTEAVDRMVDEMRRQAATIGVTVPVAPEAVQDLAATVNPLLSPLLYLCSDEPEIDDARQPGGRPGRPRPKKTKRGWRLFPADGPRIWTVGQELGAALRQARTGEAAGSTRRAHLRRAHWHGYWTGPRDRQRFIYRWIAPHLVGGREDPD